MDKITVLVVTTILVIQVTTAPTGSDDNVSSEMDVILLHETVLVESDEDLCLVCPVNMTSVGLKWTVYNSSSMGMLTLFSYDVRTDAGPTLAVDTCDPENYSLQIQQVITNRNDGDYTCWENNTPAAHFRVVIQVTPELQMIQNQMRLQGGAKNDGSDHGMNLTCKAVEAVAPLSFTWYVDGREMKVDDVSEEGGSGFSDYSSAMLMNTTGHAGRNISCLVYGPWITNQTIDLFTLRNQQQTDASLTDETPPAGYDLPDSPSLMSTTIVTASFIAAIIAGVVIFAVRRHLRKPRRTTSSHRRENPRNTRDTLPGIPKDGGQRYSQYRSGLVEDPYIDITDYATRIDADGFDLFTLEADAHFDEDATDPNQDISEYSTKLDVELDYSTKLDMDTM